MLKSLTLGAALLLTWAPSQPAAEASTALLRQEQPLQLAKKKKKPADVVVIEAEVTEEDIAGTQYYTLSGSLKNRSDEPVLNPLVYYEVYAEDTEQIVAGGSLLVQPSVIPGNGEATFKTDLNFGGRVRITLVQWLTREREPKSNDQREFFPKITDDTSADIPAEEK
ncbi:hypothetical protein C1752_04307 [Acaryochloris thomasi RCC1774]|uniref:Uncharacterized protein n=1 Tax=Acaryochloris thomasi RCC1774 TaxID=1764569 RepID=A0A2W1JKH1_9CYAN|nr:hypothetical protein [Acaryochloris thomasi]PZD71965.1 hypothetical protein C1752_04307 [Acaryochloris thomasi RCC1774]